MSIIDEKKAFLNRCYELKQREQEAKDKLEEIRTRYTGHAIQYDDMPKGTDTRDLSDYAVAIEDVKEELWRVRIAYLDSYMEISDTVEQMDDDREKDLLRLRYLLCLTWEGVADRMDLGVRQVYKIHKKALEHFEIPEGDNGSQMKACSVRLAKRKGTSRKSVTE